MVLGTTSRRMGLPRDFKALFARRPATTGLDVVLCGIWPPRYSPGRHAAKTGLKGLFCTGSGHRGGMLPRRDSTGLLVRYPTTAGLPGRDAATTRLYGTPAESWIAAGAATPLATFYCPCYNMLVGAVRERRLFRARTSLRLSRYRTQTKRFSAISLGVVLGCEGGLDINKCCSQKISAKNTMTGNTKSRDLAHYSVHRTY